MGRLTFIIGGARSGKSTYAEQLAQKIGGNTIYLATAQPLDKEMATRIKNHQDARPNHWVTLEIPYGIAEHAHKIPLNTDIVLLDCLTLLVSNILMSVAEDNDDLDADAAQKDIQSEIDTLLALISNNDAHWIVVSNEVGMGLVPTYPMGRVYRDLLGWANQQIARHANQVYFMIAGLPWTLSPAEEI